ncbi:MAG: hypothetical protein K2G55_00690 [Lachnospiraceae bacterium]|nr:hypothetical protein [Lachnospiraceae bacterium]MDE7201397.1 hypothetical protein [Lachnospiraceae bacterium]
MDIIEKNTQKLMDTADGSVVVDTINALTKKADESRRTSRGREGLSWWSQKS